MADKLVMMLLNTTPDRPHECGAPFFQAAAAAAMDIEVEIYFAGKAASLLKKGVAEKLYPSDGGDKSIYSFMQDAAELGVKFYACGGALTGHGIGMEDLIPECAGAAGGAAYMSRVMDDDWKVLSY
ncbi:MAG: DsrE family protein [Pseudomonadota bacterium]|uniref:DsrE family protein n=1 Tax=Thermithiobacillus tepidarius TaxID=929 RepID=UPI0003F79641|nr:DsrE family protein [Thermithiobacillus tepidarius]